MTAYYFERFGERPGPANVGGGGRSLRRLFGPGSDGKPMRALFGLVQPAPMRSAQAAMPDRPAPRTIRQRTQPAELDCSGDT